MENVVVAEAINIINNMDGVLKVQQLSNDDILNLIDIEMNKDQSLVPVINEGMKQCFKQDFCFVIFKKGFFRLPPSPTVILSTYDGKVLGHEILSDEDKNRYKDDDNVFFLGEDFVMFKNTFENKNKYPGKECFILPPIDFPELEFIKNANNIISSSPDTRCDEYLKEKYGYYGDASVATILVAFSLDS